MALARCRLVITDEDGTIVDSASIEVRREAGLALEPLFSDRDGAVPIANPFTATDGRDAGFYCAAGAFKITATKDALTVIHRHAAVGTAQEYDYVAALEQGKHTVWIPAGDWRPATTLGPASAQFESATNKRNFTVLDFDATADEHAHFSIAMPKSWNEGTITFQVFWMSAATGTTGVAWAMEAAAISDNESTDASWGAAVVVTDDAQSNASELYVTAESGAVTIGGAPAEGDVCFFRIFRDVSDANDDMTEDARLIGVKIFITLNAATDA